MYLSIILVVGLAIVTGKAIQVIHQRDAIQKKLNYTREENQRIQKIVYGKDTDADKIKSIMFEFENLPF
jgi:hypothetical protein